MTWARYQLTKGLGRRPKPLRFSPIRLFSRCRQSPSRGGGRDALLRNRVSALVIHRAAGESSEQSGESSEHRDGRSTSRMSYPEESGEQANSRILIAF